MRRMIAAAFLTLAACSGESPGPAKKPPATAAPAAAPVDGAGLFAARCAVCHALPDVKSRGDASWAAEVRRMVQQKGAKATSEEEAAIVRHLQQANGRD